MLSIHYKDSAKAENPGKIKTLPSAVSLRRRIPLPVKMVLLTLMFGILIWISLDYVQSRKLQNMFRSQLNEKLSEYAMIDRLHFEDHINAFQNSIVLYMSQSNFSNYMNNIQWNTQHNPGIYDTNSSPEWFPDRSVLRNILRPDYALLFDSRQNVRGVYRGHHDSVPAELVAPAPLMISKSRDQGFMTVINQAPYIITSRVYSDQSGKEKGILMFASPIDDRFLQASLGTFYREHLLALITSERNPRILVSSNLLKLPPGSYLDQFKDRYLVTGKDFFDYGASELAVKLVSFVSLAEVDSMTSAVIAKAREERAVVGFALLLAFAFIMYWISRHIQQINRSIADFSKEVSGRSPRDLPGGDQLQILKERFQSLTEEIIESREIIKRQADEKAHLIAQSSFDAIITADNQGVVQLWNSEAENIFGWSKEEAVGRMAADTIIQPRYQRGGPSVNVWSLKDKENYSLSRQFETIAYHRDGHEFPIELSVIQPETGDNRSLIAIVRNISDRKKREEDLQLFQSLINRSNDAMMIIDPGSGTYLYVNDEACKSLGYSRSELLTMDVKDIEAVLTDDFSWYRHAERIKKQTNMILESNYMRKDGSVFPVEVSVKFIDLGKSSFFVAIVRDVTERKGAEEQIKSALKENETLLREIHERVKNNLQIVSSFFSLQKDFIKDKDAKDMIVECQNRIRAIALVHEKLYRTEHFTNVNIREYISDIINSLVELYEVRQDRITIRTEIDYIMLDISIAIPCGLIINELITNALQYAFPENREGEINIKLFSGVDQTTLCISDNGVGLPTGSEIKAAESLGLLIVNTLVSQLNGIMELDRTKGTTYKITFGRKQ